MSTHIHPPLFRLPEGVAVRPVLKSGVHFHCRSYWSQELARFVGRSVVVALDPASEDSIRCYEHTGDFICTATDVNDPENVRIAQEEYEKKAARLLSATARTLERQLKKGKA